MPVIVSLEKLVALPGSRPLWPAVFEGMVAKLEDHTDERTQWGAIADWLEGDDVDERELAEAFRWVFKRTSVKVQKGKHSWDEKQWDFVSGTMPSHVATAMYDTPASDLETIPGLMAKLVAAFRAIKEELF